MLGIETTARKNIGFKYLLLDRAAFTLKLWLVSSNYSEKVAMGRVVITHSTYVEGLIPRLKALAEEKNVQTITPAVIRRVKGHCPELRLRITTPIKGGFKLVARLGSSAQEVFVVTNLDEASLLKRLNHSRPGVQKR